MLKIFHNDKVRLLLAGAGTGLAFAPTYFIPGLLGLSILFQQVHLSSTWKQALARGYLFAISFFIVALYWIAFGVSVYAKQFWWMIPLTLFGLPAFMALFMMPVVFGAWYFRNSTLYHTIFVTLWVVAEWSMGWMFTGFPWAYLGYSFAVSDVLAQFASVTGVLGLSFLAVFLGSVFYSKDLLRSRSIIAGVITFIFVLYGVQRIQDRIIRSDIKVKLVQPSIKQTDKWTPELFWQNLEQHITLSRHKGEVTVPADIIIWSEAALTAPYELPAIKNKLQRVFTDQKQTLIFGGVSPSEHEDGPLHSSMIAINNQQQQLFSYHKAHLVPFGEYVPFKKYLPIKKITAGLADYSPGKRNIVTLEKVGPRQVTLNIAPLICYEAAFSDEVVSDNQLVDLFIHITNDAWYGNSSGPYQHLYISKMRAIESGLPLIRVGNNGISTIIDPIGRFLAELPLNETNVLEEYLPNKLSDSTTFFRKGYKTLIFLIAAVAFLQLILVFTGADRRKIYPK